MLCLLTVSTVAADHAVADTGTYEPQDHPEDDHDSPGVGLLLVAMVGLTFAGFMRRRD